MFQSEVFFKGYPYDSRARKRTQLLTPNSPALAEGEGVTATWLVQSRSSGCIIIYSVKLIRRVPSGEEATATWLVVLYLSHASKKINRKSAPDELSLVSNEKNKRR